MSTGKRETHEDDPIRLHPAPFLHRLGCSVTPGEKVYTFWLNGTMI